MISDEGLEKFIKLYERKYSIKLTRQEAFNVFTKLISIVKFAYSDEPKRNNRQNLF